MIWGEKFTTDEIYTFNGKNITMNVCLQIRDVVHLIQDFYHVSFEEAVMLFYRSDTYKTLQNTENGLWAESAEYIMDCFLEENMLLQIKSKGRFRYN